MQTHQFQFGDRVIHAGKPEWGVGLVSAAETATHDGEPCQRLKIRFDRAGLKTITTVHADIRPAEARTLIERAESGTATVLDPDATERSVIELMTALPEASTDPFASLATRLHATMGLYRFEPTGASLMDWAAAQSGLSDPLSRFNRHELEAFFKRFAVTRDAQLRSLLGDARRADPDAITQAAEGAPPAGVEAARRLIGRS